MSKLRLIKDFYFDIIRLVLLGVLVIFTLIITVNSFSWFAHNRDVKANDMSISLKMPEGFGLDVTTFFINNITREETETIYRVAGDTEADERKIIPTYDINSIAYIEYERAVALKFTITSYTGIDGIAEFKALTATGMSDLFYLSNYVKIGLITGKNAITGSDDFNLGVSNFQSFVSVSGGDLTKNNTLTFNIDLSELENDEFYLVIAYDDEVINAFNEKYSNGELPDLDGGEIDCIDDITYEISKGEVQ